MECPLCEARLVQVQRDGILIEFCRSCKGAWLERMELERVFPVFSGAATGTGYAAGKSDDRGFWRQLRQPLDGWLQHQFGAAVTRHNFQLVVTVFR